jgi:hypothetical protein
MKKNLKVFQESLLKNIAARLTALNFHLNMAKREYRSKRDFGDAVILIAIIKHGESDFDITGSVALRFNAVEDLVNKFNYLATKAEKASTFTLGAEFGNIISGQQKRWTINNESGIDPVAIDFVKTVENIAIPYIDRYSDCNNALKALSGNEPSNWLHSPIHGARCQRALALTHILGDNKKIKELINQNIAFLKSRNDFGLALFETFVKTLTSQQIEKL